MTSLLCAGTILLGSAGCSDDDDRASDGAPPTTEDGARTIASGTDIEIA
jgi:hypothetical protein